MKRISVPVLIAISLVLFLSGCRTAPEPSIPKPVPAEEPEPTQVPVVEPEALEIDWAGTTWLFRDVPEGTREFPGYRGFHLGRDGRLLLINMNETLGDSWSATGNILTLVTDDKSGQPGLPLTGSFKACIPGTGSGMSGMPIVAEAISGSVLVQLIPIDSEAESAPAGIIFEQAKVNVDVIENHWIPRDMEGSKTVGWPTNREIYLMLLPDETGGMGILGYGGENRFRADISLGIDAFITGPVSMTRRTGPASNFEFVYVSNVSDSDRYVQVDDDLFLYAGTVPKVAFRVRLFD